MYKIYFFIVDSFVRLVDQEITVMSVEISN